MAKYDESYKLEVVQGYVQGQHGFRALANAHGLDQATVRRWVKSYQQHGLLGLRKKFSRYSAEFKLAVLQRMWRDDLSARETIILFDIRGGTGVISAWEQQYHDGGPQALAPRPRGRPKKMPNPPTTKPAQAVMPVEDTRSHADLLKEVKYLRAEVAYLKKLEALVQAKKQAAQKKRG